MGAMQTLLQHSAPDAHAAPTPFELWMGLLPMQLPVWHPSTAAGGSVLSATDFVEPAPLQTTLLQLPAVCIWTGTPLATFLVPQQPLLHVGSTHSLAGGQSAGEA